MSFFLSCRQNRGSQLSGWAQAVRGQLFGVAEARVHRPRPVRRSLVPHEPRVLPGIPELQVGQKNAALRDEPQQVPRLPVPDSLPREKE